ncbi:hypothetical protein R6Q59_025305 [Mikania micrantha]
MGSLQSQEARLNSRTRNQPEKTEEQALQVIQEAPRNFQGVSSGGVRYPNRGRGQGRIPERNRGPQCHICNRQGTLKRMLVQRGEPGPSSHRTDPPESFLMEEHISSFTKHSRLMTITMKDDRYKLLDDVCYAPKLEYNLLSVGQLMKKGYSLTFDEGKCIIRNKNTGVNLMAIKVSSKHVPARRHPRLRRIDPRSTTH